MNHAAAVPILPLSAVNARNDDGGSTHPVAFAASDERQFVRRAQARDQSAFEELYRRHHAHVHALCLRMTADAHRARELTQQAFVIAWQKLPAFRGDSAFGSWLHRVTVNTVLHDLRTFHRRTQRVFTTDNPAELDAAAPVAPPGLRLDLEQAIAQLPPQARVVFVLHDIEGWQHLEIAHELNLSPGTSKAHLHRARQLLQKALQ